MEGEMERDFATITNIGNGIFRRTFVWAIHNFSSYCSQNNIMIQSVATHSGTFLSHGVRWYCDLRFQHHEQYRFQYCFIVRLQLLQPTKPEAFAGCNFSILNSRDEKAITFKQYNEKTMEYNKYIICPISALTEKLDELLPNDKLKICCEVDLHDLSYQQAMNDVEVPCCKLIDDYRLLFNNKNFSDVILSAEETEFQAHKLILAARSPVFQSMFERQMKDSKHYRVYISDVNPKVLQELLRFIYTGEVMGLQEMAVDLLDAANKYALLRLKAMCEKELCSKLWIENVLQLLLLADRCNATQLKAKAIGFFKMHVTEVVKTPKWKVVVQFPHLLNELLGLGLRASV